MAVSDDSLIAREGVARVLGAAGFDIVDQVGTAEELLESVARAEPDVAIVHIRMPPTHTDEGLVAAEVLRERHPDVGVLVLSQYVEPEYALRLLEGGERGTGYVLKDRVLEIDQLAEAGRRVGEGGSVVDPTLVTQLVDKPRGDGGGLVQLTARERDVLALMAEGLSDRGIGERLFVSTKTVETHASVHDHSSIPSRCRSRSSRRSAQGCR